MLLTGISFAIIKLAPLVDVCIVLWCYPKQSLCITILHFTPVNSNTKILNDSNTPKSTPLVQT